MTITSPERTDEEGAVESFMLPGHNRAVRKITAEMRRGLLARIGHDARANRVIELLKGVYPELVGEESDRWRRFLPSDFDLEDMEGHEIPDAAFYAIEAAMEMGCFEWFHVWNAQNSNPFYRLSRMFSTSSLEVADNTFSKESMLVGTVISADHTQHQYSIVRWGKSLTPKEEVAERVEKNDRLDMWVGLGLLVLMVGVVAGFIAWSVIAVQSGLSPLVPACLAGAVLLSPLMWHFAKHAH